MNDADLKAIEQVVNHVFTERTSFKKNGGTWKQWAGKVVTIERAALAVVSAGVIVFTAGGNFQAARRDLADAVTKSTAASEENKKTAALIVDVKSEIADLTKTMRVQATLNATFDQQLKLGVTRPEFFAVIQQQVLPRLERIERRLDEAQ